LGAGQRKQKVVEIREYVRNETWFLCIAFYPNDVVKTLVTNKGIRMYFASESCNVPAVRAALMEKIKKQPELNWMALVDGAFDYGHAGVLLPNERFALYDYDGMSDLLAASPFLITLTVHNDDRLRHELSALVRHRKERPMLSFIATDASAHSVNQNFRQFANAVTDDEQEFLLRFADTRVLHELSTALQPVHWDGMTYLLSDWIVIDRGGKLQGLPLRASRARLEGKFQLSSAEFASLVTNSEPDAVINAIAESNPEALPEARHAAFYRCVVDSCSFAEKHNVRAFPDLVALAYLAVLNDGEGLKHPKLSAMLSRAEWKSGSLIDELADFIE
jgi:hypothetical protein